MNSSSDDATKVAIRKRMFFATEARGETGARFGFQWCDQCRGLGEICIERSSNGVHTAGFETCTVCDGARVLATEPLATDAGPYAA